MSRNIANDTNLFIKLKSNFGPYPVVLGTPKKSYEKHRLTEVEMQQKPGLEKTYPKHESSCLKDTSYNDSRLCLNFMTDRQVEAYRTPLTKNRIPLRKNKLYLKKNQIGLKLAGY